MSLLLIFDTETTGFKYGSNITQMAFMLVNEAGDIKDSYSSIIKPEGWEVPKEQFFIDNNMSTERCEAEGEPIYDVLRKFQALLKVCDYKVAHNLAFDNRMVLYEQQRKKITHQLFQYKKGICTMRSSTNLCQIPKSNGGLKQPNLEELHKFLFHRNFKDSHDALADVIATKYCLIELIKRGVIEI